MRKQYQLMRYKEMRDKQRTLIFALNLFPISIYDSLQGLHLSFAIAAMRKNKIYRRK